MNFKKIVDHCVKHKFLSPNFEKFSFLGDALQNRIEHEWIRSNVIQNSNTLLINSELVDQINVELVQLFLNAQSLMGSDSSLSLASITSTKKTTKTIEDVTSLSDLIEALPQTQLNLFTLTQPAQKNDEFIRLQKTRRHWWKSYLQQPVLLNTTSSASLDEAFVEQKIEFGSSALGSEPFEVLKLYKPDVFTDLQVSQHLFLMFYCTYT
jgi:hypothetical protein